MDKDTRKLYVAFVLLTMHLTRTCDTDGIQEVLGRDFIRICQMSNKRLKEIVEEALVDFSEPLPQKEAEELYARALHMN